MRTEWLFDADVTRLTRLWCFYGQSLRLIKFMRVQTRNKWMPSQVTVHFNNSFKIKKSPCHKRTETILGNPLGTTNSKLISWTPGWISAADTSRSDLDPNNRTHIHLSNHRLYSGLCSRWTWAYKTIRSVQVVPKHQVLSGFELLEAASFSVHTARKLCLLIAQTADYCSLRGTVETNKM